MQDIKSFELCGQDAILFDNSIQTSAPNEDIATQQINKLTSYLLDDKVKLLTITLPNKTILVSKQDNNHLLFKAEDNKKLN